MFLKYLCEFLGTMMLILLGDGVVANVTLNKSGMKGAGSIQITIACWAEISPQIAVRIKIIRKEMRFFMIYFNYNTSLNL